VSAIARPLTDGISPRAARIAGICGNFYMTTTFFFTEKALCDYPYCGCVYCDTQCRSFEYHPLALRLEPEELEQIIHWQGAQVSMRQRSGFKSDNVA
jgi:hypothetical protein